MCVYFAPYIAYNSKVLAVFIFDVCIYFCGVYISGVVLFKCRRRFSWNQKCVVHMDACVPHCYHKLSDVSVYNVFIALYIIHLFSQGKKYLNEVYIRKSMSIDAALHEMRDKLVVALKHDYSLWLPLTNTAVDFKNQFTHSSMFPLAIFTPSSIANPAVYEPLMKDGGHEHFGGEHARLQQQFLGLNKVERMQLLDAKTLSGFRLLITSQFTLDTYEEYLRDSLPLEKCGLIVIEQ